MLGKQIKKLRQKSNIALDVLASKAGMSVGALMQIEKGEKEHLGNQELLKIANNLNIKRAYDFAYLMQINKAPRKFHAYVVGLAKTGTSSLTGIFKNYHSRQEFLQWKTHLAVIKFKQNKISRNELRKFLIKRDLLAGFLEMDSAHFNRHYIDILAEEFPDAKFICLIRDCYSWVNSFINYFMIPKHEALHSQELCNGMPFDIPRGGLKEKQELVNNFDKYIDVPLSFWATSYRNMLKDLPRDRSLIIKTNEISKKIQKIADFVNVGQDSLVRANSHLNKAKYTVNILQKLDRDFLKAKFDEHCSDLMQKFFPGYSLDDFLDKI